MHRKRNGTRISKRTNDNRIERTDTDCNPDTDDDDCNAVAAAVPKMVPNSVGLMVGWWLVGARDGGDDDRFPSTDDGRVVGDTEVGDRVGTFEGGAIGVGEGEANAFVGAGVGA